MRTSDKLYDINSMLSISIAKEESFNVGDLEVLNKRIGKIIKEVRLLESKDYNKLLSLSERMMIHMDTLDYGIPADFEEELAELKKVNE